MKSFFHKTIFFFTSLLFFSSLVIAQTEREKGIELFQKGDYKNAISVFKKTTKKDSADLQSWYYLGLAYIKTGDSKNSIKSLTKALELDERNANTNIALAYSYLLKNDVYEAQGRAQKTLELDPKNAEAHYILGVVSLSNGSFNYAYEKAKKAIELSPAFAPAYYLKVQSLVSSFAAQTGTVLKPIQSKNQLLAEAAENLEKYLSFLPNGEQTEFLKEYLASLRFFVRYYDIPENNRPINFDLDESSSNDATGLKITYKPKPTYTTEARDAKVAGNVNLLVSFGANGKIEHTLVTKSLGYGLDGQAVKAVRGMKFEPATKNGKPVTVVKSVILSFMIY